jgi:hypothetical protein
MGLRLPQIQVQVLVGAIVVCNKQVALCYTEYRIPIWERKWERFQKIILPKPIDITLKIAHRLSRAEVAA